MQFDQITAETPSESGLAAGYGTLHAHLDAGAIGPAIDGWEALRRDYGTWSSLVHLRFSQDTADPGRNAAREYADALDPVVANHETAFKTRLLGLDTAALEARFGPHALAMWRNDITTFRPEIAADLEVESRLAAEYTALLASAWIEFDGQTLNLSGLGPYAESPDRSVRHDAAAARWAFFAQHGDTLDGLYDKLVKLRHGIARTLGDENFISLAYRRMGRLDYGPAEVATYREEVRRHVVPLVARLMERRKVENGLDRLMAWDEPMIDPEGNPKPVGGRAVLEGAAAEMFAAMDPRLANFYDAMRNGGFMDLDNRPAKAGGGFCTSFPSVGMPFIFANFNGTHHDVDVFTHEMGHAFQNYMSRHLPLSDYFWPTMEAAEIHSMSLEFLAHPHIEPMFGAATERYRRMHLIGALEFLPYGVCVDHFQHEVYAEPDLTPADRHALWRRLEQLYLPWRDWGDLDYPAQGGRWQAQMHIYRSPFYYIDYTLAQCCALQFWLAAQRDERAAFDTYATLCTLGGSRPFGGLVAAAGLVSPFTPGALRDVVRAAAQALDL
ncbi:MAG TPA: M3 family oligoendopeptidase [Acidiphilium sp.]|uniref:M3 family oligoendopeptidase n=1 Tax=unclassified Acidiphilium TaxID=2617493 RepID=UPI000BDDA1D1|nr:MULTISPECIES: M3 family oligoendopeptidase [unclassified Acidiphilium]OYV57653.1 MAG: peptidase M3 [Acidiphilium sp. 20-67-58]HQT62151.1 M3 family oligoendopeptidase [Acidiphilium sp.]HQU12018.1 M3 family oligoendopeptidase [Acidiphilium sp.]